MSDPRDYKLDLSRSSAVSPGSPAGGTGIPPAPASAASAAPRANPRPFLSILFACCNVYARVYRSRDGTHYDAVCPICRKRARFVVGPHGANSRAFVIQ